MQSNEESTPTTHPSAYTSSSIQSTRTKARFIESESDLDSALKQFLPLTQNPAEFYPELVKTSAASLLASLLSHENTDIATGVVEVIQELTDEDVGEEEEIDEEEDERPSTSGPSKATRTRMAIAEFIDELLNNSLLDLLVANLSRLDEAEESDSRGVYSILAVFENLLSFMPPLADQIVSETTLLPWLIKRVQVKGIDSNKQYASQILAIILQQSRENVLKLGELEGMEAILTVLSVSPASWPVVESRLTPAIPQEGPRRWRGSRIHGRHVQLSLHRSSRARNEEAVS